MCKQASMSGNEYVERMKAERKRPAVLKTHLSMLKSSRPSAVVFAFEGNDDKLVYFHWVNRIRPSLKYEPFPCDGKEQVLELRDMLQRDVSGMGRGVYFFVDRDYDDLRGRLPSAELFMTDEYSIENYLVCSEVLEELLKNEFHCHAEFECRRLVKTLFEAAHSEFLRFTRDINFRLFQVRRLRIELKAALPEKSNRLAEISIDRVSESTYRIEDLVKPEREPTAAETSALEAEFDELNKAKRYRGKFALLFFMKWLERLAEDRNQADPQHFPRITNGAKVQFHTLNLNNLAPKSPLPNGLSEFINRIEYLV